MSTFCKIGAITLQCQSSKTGMADKSTGHVAVATGAPILPGGLSPPKHQKSQTLHPEKGRKANPNQPAGASTKRGGCSLSRLDYLK